MSKTMKNLIPPLIMMLFGILIIVIVPYQININDDSQIGSRFFPYMTAGLIAILSVVSFVKELINRTERNKQSNSNALSELEEKNNYGILRVFFVSVILLFGVIFIPILGFLTTTWLTIIIFMIIMGNKKLYQLIITPILFVILIYFIFSLILNIPLPEGIFI